MHENKNMKKCHYYNNLKACPYEDIGCKFEHKVSEQCYFQKQCRNKLCQFRHELTENEKNKELSELKKFDLMNDYDQFEVYQEICLNICWGGDHKCFDHDEDNRLMGIDVHKIRDDYNNDREEEFKCENCSYSNKEMETVRSHFLLKHKDSYRFKCWQCDKEIETISEYKKHYGEYHYKQEDISESES